MERSSLAAANAIATANENMKTQWNSLQNFRMQSAAQRAQESNSNRNQTAQTYAQMRAENSKTSAQIHQVNQETATKVSEMARETYVHRRKSSDKLHSSIVKLMTS
ncbi:MAG: hypothetical protein WC314_03490 [Vulcanimicrobiota bacterium]